MKGFFPALKNNSFLLLYSIPFTLYDSLFSMKHTSIYTSIFYTFDEECINF